METKNTTATTTAKEATVKSKATVTLTQNEAAAILDLVLTAQAIATTAEDNDDWCRFCGEGHGEHEPACITQDGNLISAAEKVAEANDKARKSDDVKTYPAFNARGEAVRVTIPE